jgi:hypothetical protein
MFVKYFGARKPQSKGLHAIGAHSSMVQSAAELHVPWQLEPRTTYDATDRGGNADALSSDPRARS